MKDEILNQFKQIIAKFDKKKLEEEANRRKHASQDLQELIQRTNLVNGGTWTFEDIANSIKIQKQVHNINPVVLPKFMGNYNYNVYFKGFTGSEQDFINEHPELDGSSGHPSIDSGAFSKDLSKLLTSSGTHLALAFQDLLNHLGAGLATTSGYLYLYQPDKYALINGASIDGLESVTGKLKTKEINHYYGLECNSREISIEKPDSTIKRYLAYTYLFRQLIDGDVIKDFHYVDALLWTTSKNQKKDHYFAISLAEEESSRWGEYFDKGYHAIGWEINHDLSGLSEEEIGELYSEAYPERSNNAKTADMYSIVKFVNLEEGDMILANKGKGAILGAGKVKSGYYFDNDAETFPHRVKIDWFNKDEKDIPEQSGWISTVKVLSKGQFNDILKYEADDSSPEDIEFFTPEMFNWFEKLSANPTKEFIQETRFVYDNAIHNPFKRLVKSVAGYLNKQLLLELETQKHVRASILKNDYGKGGAYDYLWFAFYPKGSSRIRDAQLYFSVNKDHVSYGFYMGEYAKSTITRFRNNVRVNKQGFLELLHSMREIDGMQIKKISEGGDHVRSDSIDIPSNIQELDLWIENHIPEITLSLSKDEVLKKENMAADIANVFNKLYPIWLYAIIPDITETIEATTVEEIDEVYSKENFVTETYWKEADVDHMLDVIERKKNVVLYGPPGTGKTFLARNIAKVLIEGRNSNIKYIQFHQSYAYEDFIEGIRPVSKEDSKGNSIVDYPIQSGIFKSFCKEASKFTDQKFVLIIDEFNRGNISKIFGELLYLLEYRDSQNSIELPYSKAEFFIPDNLYIIATMNTADKSLTHIDFAMRRRFAFIRFDVDTNILLHWGIQHNLAMESVASLVNEINDSIGDENYHIGISYFMKENLPEAIESIWRYEIFPYLEDYFLEDEDNKIGDFTWEKVKVKLHDILQ